MFHYSTCSIPAAPAQCRFSPDSAVLRGVCLVVWDLNCGSRRSASTSQTVRSCIKVQKRLIVLRSQITRPDHVRVHDVGVVVHPLEIHVVVGRVTHEHKLWLRLLLQPVAQFVFASNSQRESSLPEHTAAIISCDRSAPVLAAQHKDKKNGVAVSPPREYPLPEFGSGLLRKWLRNF